MRRLKLNVGLKTFTQLGSSCVFTDLVAALCRLSPIYKKKFQPGSHHPDLSQKLPNFALIFPPICIYNLRHVDNTQVAGAWSERQKMFHGGSFLKLADDDV